MDRKKLKQIIEEFISTQCIKCRSYFVCGGEVSLCSDFEKYIKDKEKK